MDDTGGEGRKKLTWIWNIQGIEADLDKQTQAGMYQYLLRSFILSNS
jgi:hypothetical protein